MSLRLALPLLAVVLYGCPRAPLDLGPRGLITDPDVAFEAVVARRGKVRSVSGEAKVRAKTRDASGSASQFVLAEAPDRLRLELLSFFGQPVAVLASDGRYFQLHDLENGEFTAGPATPGNISRLLPLQMEPAELVSLLLGEVPLLAEARPAALRLDERARAYVLELRGAQAHGRFPVQEIGLEPATLRPLWTVLPQRAGLDRYRVAFHDFEGELDLPRRLSLSVEDGKESLGMRWTERELNPEIDPELFRLEPPPGYRESGGRYDEPGSAEPQSP